MQIDQSTSYEAILPQGLCPQVELKGEQQACPSLSTFAQAIFSAEYAILQTMWRDDYEKMQVDIASKEELEPKKQQASRNVKIQGIACGVLSESIGITLVTMAWTTPVGALAASFMTAAGVFTGGVLGLSCLAMGCLEDEDDVDSISCCSQNLHLKEELKLVNQNISTRKNNFEKYQWLVNFFGDIGKFHAKWSEFKQAPCERKIPPLFTISDKIKPFLKKPHHLDFQLMHHACTILDSGTTMAKQWKVLVAEAAPICKWSQANNELWANLKRNPPSKRDYERFYDETNVHESTELHAFLIKEGKAIFQETMATHAILPPLKRILA